MDTEVTIRIDDPDSIVIASHKDSLSIMDKKNTKRVVIGFDVIDEAKDTADNEREARQAYEEARQ